ncbi:MAG: 50S ribosomal protein L24 [Candidatus Limnocylindrales bacterium]|jgi:large subunit ribosomal protein L24
MAPVKNAPANKVPEIRTGDTVVVLHGKDAGKRGKVERVLRNRSAERPAKAGWKRTATRPISVVISGINIAKRHTKPRQTMKNDRAPQIQQGGIVDKPMPIDASNVMIVCPRCERVTRVKHQTLSTGKSARVCGHCNEQLEVGV